MPSDSAIDLPPGWRRAATAALAAKGAVLVLGGPDSGKSTLCRFILDQALATGIPVALVDGDLGQSHLGPPATLGLNFYPPHLPDESGLLPDVWYFIGQTSPPGKMLELTVGLRRLAEVARGRGCQRLIVNTSGFISGPAAQRLKVAKAEALQPRLCLGLQRGEELASILTPLRQYCPEVISLPVSPLVQPKLLPQRRLYRQQRFAAYFAAAHPQAVSLEQVIWLGFPFGQGTPCSQGRQEALAQALGVAVLHAEETGGIAQVVVSGSLEETDLAQVAEEQGPEGLQIFPWSDLEQRLVGLLDARLLTLGLGLLLPSPWERRQLLIHTPLPSWLLTRVKFCRLGKIRLDLEGEEL